MRGEPNLPGRIDITYGHPPPGYAGPYAGPWRRNARPWRRNARPGRRNARPWRRYARPWRRNACPLPQRFRFDAWLVGGHPHRGCR